MRKDSNAAGLALSTGPAVGILNAPDGRAGGQRGKHGKSLAFTSHELAALVLAISRVIEDGVADSPDNFPCPDDLKALKRVSTRFWAALGVPPSFMPPSFIQAQEAVLHG